MGLSMVMMRYQIDDIRHLLGGLEVSEQFRGAQNVISWNWLGRHIDLMAWTHEIGEQFTLKVASSTKFVPSATSLTKS